MRQLEEILMRPIEENRKQLRAAEREPRYMPHQGKREMERRKKQELKRLQRAM